MMNTLLFIIACLWYVRILKNILSYVHLWYVKEYRPDRMIIHLRTEQGKRILFLPYKRPPISPKTIALVVLLVGCSFLGVLFLPMHFIFRMLILDVLTFPVSCVFVCILQAPTMLYHEFIIQKATQALRAHKKMTVIGITGSFGKTSTKEFLSTILTKNHRVLKTQASKNSPIGIAETVLAQLTPDTDAFVVEMGAYRPGEIQKMTAMTRPEVGIVTHINAQHQDLFRTIETTKKAKYELLMGLTGKRIAVVNADNMDTREMGMWAKKDGCQLIWFTVRPEKIKYLPGRVIAAKNISSGINEIRFVVSEKEMEYPVKAVIAGEHFVINLLAAIAGAVASGMSLKEASLLASTVKPIDRVMERLKGKNGETLINDTFNNNPDAAKAAIDYLAKFSGRKYLVFQPMIELGSFAASSHEEIGKYAAVKCDEIILTNTNFKESFEKGVARVRPKKPLVVLEGQSAADYLHDRVTAKDTILFKGKEAAFVMKYLVKKA